MAPFSPFPSAHPRGKNCGGTEKYRLLHPPSYSPLDSAPHAPGTEHGYKLSCFYAGRIKNMKSSLLQLNMVGARLSRAAPGRSGPLLLLVLFFASLLAGSFASECGLHTLFLAGLQVKGVALDLLDNVFLLHLALEATQSILEGFALLKPNFCQTDTPPNSSGWTE